MTKLMTAPDFRALVKQMRQAQKVYFREHTQSSLRDAIALERKVDDALEFMEKIEKGQPAQLEFPDSPQDAPR